MKKYLTSLLATIFSCVMLAGVASAQVITNTGPGSNNTVTNNTTRTCSSTNSNSATVTNNNSQTGTSGSANTSGNTNGGSATSGSSSNSNNTSTSVTVNNSGACGAASSTPGAPTTTSGVTPSGGRGAGESVALSNGGQGSDAQLVASLPATGSTTTAQYLAGGFALMSGLTIAGYIAKTYFLKTAL